MYDPQYDEDEFEGTPMMLVRARTFAVYARTLAYVIGRVMAITIGLFIAEWLDKHG